jgi:peptidoglycan/LPS O-acetylase OafA/YrhL
MHRVAASTAVTWEDAPRGASAAEKTAQIASLTGLRGFAALMVVVIHTSARTEYPWLGLPSYGPVSLFVLSGFLLYRPWARWIIQSGSRPSVREFARRRIARIFPAYLVVLVAVSLLYSSSRPVGADGWLRAMTLTWIYVPEPMRSALLHTWSLATELSWYAALPVLAGLTGLVARGMPRERGFWVAAAMIMLALPISAAWRWFIHVDERDMYLTYPLWLPGYLFCFAGGALVSHFVEGRRAGLVSLDWLRGFLADRWASLVLALTISLIATSPLGGPHGFLPRTFVENQVRVVGATLVALILLLTVVLGPTNSPLSTLFSARWANAVGRWSYGIYLWHVPVIFILERDITFPDGPAGLAWRLLWVVIISIPLGAATYAWVERPTIAWSRRAAGRREPRHASSSTPIQASTETPAPSRSESSAE